MIPVRFNSLLFSSIELRLPAAHFSRTRSAIEIDAGERLPHSRNSSRKMSRRCHEDGGGRYRWRPR